MLGGSINKKVCTEAREEKKKDKSVEKRKNSRERFLTEQNVGLKRSPEARLPQALIPKR